MTGFFIYGSQSLAWEAVENLRFIYRIQDQAPYMPHCKDFRE